MKIAIVDDRPEARDLLKKLIEDNTKNLTQSVEITLFNDGIELIDKYQSHFDLIYLDVEMEIMDGMTTAQKIRKVDSEVILVFVTNHAQVAIQGYSVDASDFLLKPLTAFTFAEHFKKILRKLKTADDSILVKVSGTMKRVNVHTILYVESQGHYIDFVTTNEKFTIIDSMKNMETLLDSQRFYRCNNSYIVNFAHVSNLDRTKSLLYIGDVPIQISRSRKKECIDRFTQFLGGQLV